MVCAYITAGVRIVVMKSTLGEAMKTGKKDGMTLVELMVALAVAGLAFAGIVSMSTHSMKVISYCKNETNSMQAAQYELEKIRTLSWDELTALPGSYTVTSVDNYALGSAYLNSASADVLITGYPNGLPTDPMRAVSVTVRYIGIDGTWDDNTLVTLIAEEGMIQ